MAPCTISDAHTTDDMDYKWRKTKANKRKGIEIVSKEMAQFELVGIETMLKDTKNSKGKYRRITCSIHICKNTL